MLKRGIVTSKKSVVTKLYEVDIAILLIFSRLFIVLAYLHQIWTDLGWYVLKLYVSMYVLNLLLYYD
jgi:hypothetical protein